MSYAPDRVPDTRYEPTPPTYPPSAAPAYTPDPRYPYDARPATKARDTGREIREEVTREVTAGPFHFGVKEGILGILGIFAILGAVLGVMGFAAAFALDNAAAELNDGDGGNTADDVAARASLLPALLVSLLPFMAAPVLAIGCGAWAGHASRHAMIGSIAGGVGAFAGPIVTLLITGVGFALGAGAATLDLSQVNAFIAANGWGIAPGWAATMPYLFTGAGLLWLLANTIGGALTGGLVGGLLDRDRYAMRRADRRERHARRTLRY